MRDPGGTPLFRRLLSFKRLPVRALLLTTAGLAASALLIFGLLYLRFSALVDAKLRAGAFAETINIYSAPRLVSVGDALSAEETVESLRRGGYSTLRGNPVGWYTVGPDRVEIFPGRDSYLGAEPVSIDFAGRKIVQIISLGDQTEREQVELFPQLIANISGEREKRRLVRFSEIPLNLIDAVISVEDKRFFQHGGLDIFRMVKAAYVDLKQGRKEQGASTLTMQLARGFLAGAL
jgi:penicillin-binding protein 1B